MINRHRRLEEEIKEIRCQISQLPEGDFYCSRNGKRYKWYQSIGNGEPSNYISKSERDFAEKLTFKKYLTLQLEDWLQEKKAIEAYLKTYPNENSKLYEILKHPEYQRPWRPAEQALRPAPDRQ